MIGRPWTTHVVKDGMGGQEAGCAGDRAARMGAGAGQVEALDAPERARPEAPGEDLVAQHLAVEDVPAGDGEAGLELARAEREAVDHAGGQARAGLGEAGDRRVGREALAEQRQDVTTLGCQRRVGGCLLYTSPSPRDS